MYLIILEDGKTLATFGHPDPDDFTSANDGLLDIIRINDREVEQWYDDAWHEVESYELYMGIGE